MHGIQADVEQICGCYGHQDEVSGSAHVSSGQHNDSQEVADDAEDTHSKRQVAMDSLE